MFKWFKKREKINVKSLWNFDYTIIEFLVPRLKLFREKSQGYPDDVTGEEWDSILDKIIKGLEAYKAERPWDKNLSTQENLDLDKTYYAKNASDFQNAMELLTKYFRNLWW